jgi:imidazolonepropionase-like amidohydrolase
MQAAARAFQLARKLGVTIGNGSDVGVFAHGDNARELEWMVKLGMTPLEACARPPWSMRRCWASSALGQLREGYLADVVAVQGDPTQDGLAKSANGHKDGTIFTRP